LDPQSNHVVFAMLAVFGTAKLLAEVCERFKQPGIVGEILAGVLIGPSVLGWVAPNQTITTLADLGVMFLLFRVGLEVRPRELLRVGQTALAVAVLGVVVPFMMGWFVMWLWGEPRIEAVFVAAGLVATSVGITAHMLAARGLLDQRASQTILAAAIIDDVLGFIVLAVVSSLARDRVSVVDLTLTASLAIAFTVVVAHWGSRTVSRMFPRLQQTLRAGEVEFNLAVVGLFALALVASYAGVAAIIGSFLAGLALSESLEKRVQQMFQGVSEFLTPFFLVGIGLHLDIKVFTHKETFVLTALIVGVAVVSKLAGSGLGAIRMGWKDALRVGCGMVPRGEVGMVVAQIGLGLKVISPDIYGVVVFVAVFTTIIGPALLNVAFQGVEISLAVPSQQD
jgi:Kef-type K+ transport system membrane component KefB